MSFQGLLLSIHHNKNPNPNHHFSNASITSHHIASSDAARIKLVALRFLWHGLLQCPSKQRVLEVHLCVPKLNFKKLRSIAGNIDQRRLMPHPFRILNHIVLPLRKTKLNPAALVALMIVQFDMGFVVEVYVFVRDWFCAI